MCADIEAVGKEPQDVLRRCVCSNVIIRGLAMEKDVANATADEEGLVAVALKREADRVGEFAGIHGMIMRLGGEVNEVEEVKEVRDGLWRRSRSESGSGAAEDEAGDVVGLAGCADEIFDGLHEELQGLLRVQVGKPSDNVEPAIVGKFFAGGIEGFDDAVGEKDERVARLQRDFSGRECGFRRDAERKGGRFEALRGSVCATNDRGIVPCVDVGEAAGGGIEFGQDGGGEALAAKAVGASVVIQADGEFAEGQAFGGDGA